VDYRRLVRLVVSLVSGSISVAIGLYFGRFIAGVAALPFASSRQAIPFATGISWWAFVGLIAGLALAFTALSRSRVRFIAISLLGFALGGGLAALLAMTGSADRNAIAATLAVPLGGALAGLLMGVSARLGVRSVIVAIVGALAMAIAAPHIAGSALPPRSLFDVLLSLITGSTARSAADAGAVAANTFSLLVPGALIGAVLAALAPSEAGRSTSA